MKQFANKAFTLVELLIVIGIIGLLAVTVLLTLNPAEAQKKTRDTKRIKDAQTIQAVVEQFINDGGDIPTGWETTAVGVSSAAATTNNQGQACAAANWLGVDVCNYTKTVPTDPMNNRNASCADSATPTTAVANCLMVYQLRVGGAGSSDYEIRVRQESTSNSQKLASDGGNDTQWFELFSGPNTVLTGN